MTEQETMWEKYGVQQSEMEEVVCEECTSLMGYSWGNIDAIFDDTFILCPDCMKALP